MSIEFDRASAVSGLAAVIIAGHRYRLAAAAHFGLDLVESHVIGYLDAYGPMHQVRLAQHLGVTSGGVTGVVDRLERSGTVRRVPDPHDRRHRLLELTERARQIMAESNARLARSFDELGPDAVATLIEALPQLAVGMDGEADQLRR